VLSFGIKLSRLQSKALVARVAVENQNVVLVKPHTYMNLSGQAVSSPDAVFYRIPQNQLFVFYDDIELPVVQIRTAREGGSDRRNRGLASIISN